MFLFVLSALLASSLAQYEYNPLEQWRSDWCMDYFQWEGLTCFAGSPLQQKARSAFQECCLSTFTPGLMDPCDLEERYSSNGEQCPPLSEVNLLVNNEENGFFHSTMCGGAEERFADCFLGAMGFLAPTGYVRAKKVQKALETLDPSVLENFSNGNTAKERWTNCTNKYGYKNFMMAKASECSEAYTEDEAKVMKFYGARWDAIRCLTEELGDACSNAGFYLLH